MKNELKNLLTFIFAFAIIFLVLAIGGEIETTYNRRLEVFEVHSDYVTLEDEQGFLWDWETEENDSFEVGQMYEVKFFTNYTDNTRIDDEIKKIKLVK